MSIVVDTSIIIAVILNDKSKKNIIRLTKGETLSAPASLQWEIGNAFSVLFKRGQLDIHDAKRALNYYREIPVRFIDIDINNSLEIADRYKIYAYDAYFIATAKDLNLPLCSLDNKLLAIAREEGLKIIEVDV